MQGCSPSCRVSPIRAGWPRKKAGSDVMFSSPVDIFDDENVVFADVTVRATAS